MTDRELRLRHRIDQLSDRIEELELERDTAVKRAGKWYQRAYDAERSRDMWKARVKTAVAKRLEAA
jgi:hypothetical protein